MCDTHDETMRRYDHGDMMMRRYDDERRATIFLFI